MDGETRSLGLVVCCVLFTACGGDVQAIDATVSEDAPVDAAPLAPAFRNPVDLPNNELAPQALRLLGAPQFSEELRCRRCHGMTKARIRAWRSQADTSAETCLTDLSIANQASAFAMIDCLREDKSDPTSIFRPHKLGVYSVAAGLDWFAFLFERAYGQEYPDVFADFRDRMEMPRLDPSYSQGEFDILAEWVARGLPLLDDLMPEDPPPVDCTTNVSADVYSHVNAMVTQGWAARNRNNSILMHGCAGAQNAPHDCLSSYPTASSLGFLWNHIPGATVRMLHLANYRSLFWTRSSADGRYIAHGGGVASSTIVDLGRGGATVGTAAWYDPTFFPDNSGFIFQAGETFGCDQRVLASGPDYVSYEEDGCGTIAGIGLYQNVGAGLVGDYWAADAPFVSDGGTREPKAWFDGVSRITFVPMIHDPSAPTPNPYIGGASVEVSTPFEGDVEISPSSLMTVTRLAGPGGRQLGYVMRKVVATPFAGSYDIQATEVARYCYSGSKADFSYDERWLVYQHHVDESDANDFGYADASDPGFQEYLTQGAANIYLIDLLSGQRIRITDVEPGVFAVFPHFRSDGWIYFVVRRQGQELERVVASDAALVLGQ